MIDRGEHIANELLATARGRNHFAVTFWYPNGVIVDFSAAQFVKGFNDLRIRIYGTDGTVDSAYEGDVRISGDREFAGGSTTGIFTSGAVNNIKDSCASLASGNYLYDTVQPSADSNLTVILGRIAAYEGRAVTWDEMIKARRKVDPKLQLPT